MRLFVLVFLLLSTPSDYDAGHDSLYRWYLRFTIIGVVGALVGIGAIYSQTKATAKAAEATAKSAKASEASVKLQEIALRQWVNLKDWEVWMEKKTSTVRIRFAVVNPTTLPLEVNSVNVTAIVLRNKAGSSVTSDELEVLAPNNPLILDASIPLTEEQVSELIALEDSVAIDIFVKCTIIFTDSSSRRWCQIFERAMYFGKGELFALTGDKSLEPSVRDLKNHLKEQKAN